MEYRVIWTIDLDAESTEDAAHKAVAIHRNPDSWATHFEVRDPQGQTQEVDLGCRAERSRSETVYVLVPKEEGIVRDVQVFNNREAADRAEREWLAAHGLVEGKDRERASDWGTGIAIWECETET